MNNGEHIEYYSDGEIRYRCNYLGVNRHGEFINYFTSGEISSKYYYIYDNLVIKLEWLSYNRNLTLELLGL